MELIHVDLSSAELVSMPGPVLVSHGASELSRVLLEGEEVLVSDRDGEFHAAVVLAAGPQGDGAQQDGAQGGGAQGGGLAYQLHIGARLPMDMAAQRLTDVELTPEEQGLHEIVDLLGDLRRSMRPDDWIRPQP